MAGVANSPANFWQRVDQPALDACWRWRGSHDLNGYGRLRWHGRDQQAHRIAYQLAVGPIPDGLELDHVRARGCVHRDCCNPAHLEAVTHRENIMRSDAPLAINARKTQCSRGHELAGVNLYVRSNGYRQCRACASLRARERRAA